MKKVLLIIFLVLIGSKVNASSYYSDYGKYSVYQEEKVEKSDLVDVEEIELYELYQENISYEFLEKSTFEETGKVKRVETPWVDDISLIDTTKEIETYYQYELPLAKEYESIRIVNPTNRNIKVHELKIYNIFDEEIIYEIKDIVLYSKDQLFLRLQGVCNLAKLGFKMDLFGYDEVDENIRISLYAVENKNYLSINDKNNMKDDFITLQVGDKDSLKIDINDFGQYKIFPDEIETIYMSTTVLPSSIKNYFTFYRNIYDLKEYKIVNREYLNKYADSNQDNLFIDLTHNKKYYRFRKRDKVTISDNLVINSKDQKLNSFIEYSSINLNDIAITSDVNYNKNGIYKINFVLPFKTVTKDIKVNIEDNYIELINEQAKYINELNKTVNESVYAVDKKNLEIKEVIIDEETKYKEIVEKLNTCFKDKKSLEEQKKVLKEEKTVKQQSIGYVYVLLLLIILLIACRKKILKKNS